MSGIVAWSDQEFCQVSGIMWLALTLAHHVRWVLSTCHRPVKKWKPRNECKKVEFVEGGAKKGQQKHHQGKFQINLAWFICAELQHSCVPVLAQQCTKFDTFAWEGIWWSGWKFSILGRNVINLELYYQHGTTQRPLWAPLGNKINIPLRAVRMSCKQHVVCSSFWPFRPCWIITTYFHK